MAITQQRFEQIKKELDKKKEIVPATYDGVFKAIMDKCPKFRADLTSRITGIPKELILNTYKEKNTEYKIDNALEKGIDFISMSRPFIADENFVQKLKNDEGSICVNCNECFEIFKTQHKRCALRKDIIHQLEINFP